MKLKCFNDKEHHKFVTSEQGQQSWGRGREINTPSGTDANKEILQEQEQPGQSRK